MKDSQMSNRNKIKKFCKENNIRIIHLDSSRSTDTNGGYYKWELSCELPNKEVMAFSSFYGCDSDGKDIDIDMMFGDLIEIIESINMKSKNKEVDQFEKLDDSFHSFINELSDLGKIARSELSHSNFDGSEEKSVKDAINEYSKFLNKVNDKFDKLKMKFDELHSSSAS